MDLRKIIKARMEDLGVSQRQLQEQTGVLQHRISDYLTGKRDMTGKSLERIMDALGLEVRPVRRHGKE